MSTGKVNRVKIDELPEVYIYISLCLYVAYFGEWNICKQNCTAEIGTPCDRLTVVILTCMSTQICKIQHQVNLLCNCLEDPLIARFMGPTRGLSGTDRTQVGPMLAHELCNLGLSIANTLILTLSRHRSDTFMPSRCQSGWFCYLGWWNSLTMHRSTSTRRALCLKFSTG